MRFLADENFPRAAVTALGAAGHDVVWVRANAPGAKDQVVFEQAAREGRILLTFDKDFGELARRSPMPRACGVVLFRIAAPKSAAEGQRLAEILTSRDDWTGHFSVVEPARVRMRPLGA